MNEWIYEIVIHMYNGMLSICKKKIVQVSHSYIYFIYLKISRNVNLKYSHQKIKQ